MRWLLFHLFVQPHQIALRKDMPLHCFFQLVLSSLSGQIEAVVQGIDHEMIVMDSAWRARAGISGFTAPVQSLYPSLKIFRNILSRIDVECHPVGKATRLGCIGVVHNNSKGFGLRRETSEV